MTEKYDGVLNSIHRRCFLKKAGAFAAASIFCGTMISCADEGIDIPCLGPAAPPVPVSGMTYIRASQIGCALDCDLKTGRNKNTGGNATDDGPKINAAMADASATNPITLIIDGSALISGLFLPAGGHWAIAGLGCGTGFFIKDGTNNDGIHNGPSKRGHTIRSGRYHQRGSARNECIPQQLYDQRQSTRSLDDGDKARLQGPSGFSAST